MSVGKTSQLTRHTTTIQVNNSDSENVNGINFDKKHPNNVPTNANEELIHTKMLNEMQKHLNQMEEELAIVSEESKDLQQRLIDRQQDLEKKVRRVFYSFYLKTVDLVSRHFYAMVLNTQNIILNSVKKHVIWLELLNTFAIQT